MPYNFVIISNVISRLLLIVIAIKCYIQGDKYDEIMILYVQ